MKAKQLLNLIDEGESTKLEFKRKVNDPHKIAKEICAFANTKGGYLLIGVDDDKTICGVRSEKTEVDMVEKSCQFFIEPLIEPQIEIDSVFNKDIIVVKIDEGLKKPYKLITEDKETGKSIKRAYIRIGEKSIEASREMTRLLKDQNDDAKNLMLSIGDNEKRLFTYLEAQIGRAHV